MADLIETNTKHCPFCGYNDVRVAIERDKWGSQAKASCNICGAAAYGMGVFRGDKTASPDELVSSAIWAWNTRKEPIQDEEASKP